MLSSLLRGISDLSVITRGLFYFTQIPRAFPDFGKKLFEFATNGKKDCVARESVNADSFLALTSNVTSLYSLKNEEDLWREIHDASLKEGKYGLGAVLVSEKNVCRLCGKELRVKASRIVNVVIYHETRGTFLGCRIPKLCSGRSCNMVQHYGYYTLGEKKYYDEDWEEHEYLLCSGKTAFEIRMLKKFEIEILLGKLSFKEKADIYNDVHEYHMDAETNKDHVRTEREGTSPCTR